jgi:hypothetical protein
MGRVTARAVLSASAMTRLGIAAHLVAIAVRSLWVAAADIGELLFTRWLCDGAAVAVACGVARLAAWAWRALNRAARGVFGGAVPEL